ncbi:hypothetical protein FFLO_06762 [Filobasidium floriforme]|uniref:Alcohol acetyltransferase n=1 Tax=Filobasidium floriforme TaxID=5210 RepID=A0A8K0JEM3_9TREE|nr:uncharacterized protein HD553DRAFT_127920 [Filobasidium floriforme]KAG7527615.1 hypothetical protein FFLO_06762 [Filobasidium floriforme]KAH8080024.1 hypothetical protein HD553DRAFT_127920 [Filobasidium floriforme]
MVQFEGRPISAHERYSLTQDNLAQPPLITYVAAFCTPTSTSTSTSTAASEKTGKPLPSLSGLQTALDESVGEEAILNARVVGWETTQARWGPLDLEVKREVEAEIEGEFENGERRKVGRRCETVLDKPLSLSEYGISPNTVAEINTDEDKPDDDHGHSDVDLESEKLGKVMSHLLHQETETARRELNVETGDLWRIVRVLAPNPTSNSNPNPTSNLNSNSDNEHEVDQTGFVVLVVHHIITDGMGGLEFFSQLLQRALRYDQERERVRVRVRGQVEGEGEGDMESQPLLRSQSESESQKQARSTEPTVSNKPTTTRPLPPALESTIRLKPALSTLLRAVWYELLVPKFPGWLQRFFVDENATKVWIGRSIAGGDDKLKVNVKAAKRNGDELQDQSDLDLDVEGGGQSVDLATLPCRYSVVPLPAELIGRLVHLSAARHQAASNAPRVKLTSLLMAALMLAVHSTLDEQTLKDGVNIEGNVPMSERNLELGHPAFLGNLMVPAMYRKWFPTVVEGQGQKTEEERYWDVAEDLAERLENGQMRKAGRETWGLCAHIPDGQRQKLLPPQNPSSGSNSTTTRARGAFTGWEEYFGASHRRTKYSHSVQFSNLGRVPPSFPKVDAVVWGHPAACFDSHAVEVDCVGLAGGEVWMSVNWREGNMVDGVLIGRIIKEMKGLLGRLVKGSA